MNHMYHLANMKQDNEIEKIEVGECIPILYISKFHISQSYPKNYFNAETFMIYGTC